METQRDFRESFSEWLKVLFPTRDIAYKLLIICNSLEQSYGSECNFTDKSTNVIIFHSQILFLRKSYGSRLNIFAPVHDLSYLSKTMSEGRSLVPGRKNDAAISGGQILGDEYSDHVVKVGKIVTS